MQVLRSNSIELAPEFGIMAARWTQYAGLGDVPFGAGIIAVGDVQVADATSTRTAAPRTAVRAGEPIINPCS